MGHEEQPQSMKSNLAKIAWRKGASAGFAARTEV